MRLDYEVKDHGVEHAQYWQGEGVVNTPYTEIVTGVGDSAHAAAHDALEQFFQTVELGPIVVMDVERMVKEIDQLSRVEDARPEDADSEVTHFVTIKWKLREEREDGVQT